MVCADLFFVNTFVTCVLIILTKNFAITDVPIFVVLNFVVFDKFFQRIHQLVEFG